MQTVINQTIEVLKKGGAILYPTDTIWGIGCDATNEAAVDNIFRIKERPKNKNLIILVSAVEEIRFYVHRLNIEMIEFINSQQTPTTIIFNKAKNLPSNLISVDGSIAIRVCKDKFCNALIKQFGKPIVSTSANISGTNTPINFDTIDFKIKKEVDFIVNMNTQESEIKKPSQIFRINESGVFERIR